MEVVVPVDGLQEKRGLVNPLLSESHAHRHGCSLKKDIHGNRLEVHSGSLLSPVNG